MKMQKVRSLFKEYAIFIRALNKSLQRVHTAFALKTRKKIAVHFRGDVHRGGAFDAYALTDVKGQPSLNTKKLRSSIW